MHLHNLFVSIAVLTAVSSSQASCWSEAGKRYGVSAALLYAVASAESDLKPQAINLTHKARTGTYDIGLMQINSGHLGKLASAGVTETDLYDPCTNVKVGAWILSQMFAKHGVSWDAVGAYNAACTQLKGEACQQARSKYAWRVYRRLPTEAKIDTTEHQAKRFVKSDAAAAQPFIIAARVAR